MIVISEFIHFEDESQVRTLYYRGMSDRHKTKSRQSSVLITGATEGIGRATALRFAALGRHVIAVARSTQRLQDLQSDIDALGSGTCDGITLDVSDAAACLQTIGEAAGRWNITTAVMNAGIGQYGPFARSAWSDIEPLLRTNIDGAMACTGAVLPQMMERRDGSIVLVASIIGKRALPYNAAYCASKAAVIGFADALRLEARAHGIHVGVVNPARTDTRFFERMTYSTPQSQRRHVPTASPDRVADAILRCSTQRKREINVSPGGKLYTFFGVHFPRLSDHLLYHSVPKSTET
ncbi:MAG: hypothetical protein C0600_10545 [Ignavibacteria bacterium]|nr:MAG: hypothetical protein C0600_10545 [Ignavibacteria bacterium]